MKALVRPFQLLLFKNTSCASPGERDTCQSSLSFTPAGVLQSKESNLCSQAPITRPRFSGNSAAVPVAWPQVGGVDAGAAAMGLLSQGPALVWRRGPERSRNAGTCFQKVRLEAGTHQRGLGLVSVENRSVQVGGGAATEDVLEQRRSSTHKNSE